MLNQTACFTTFTQTIDNIRLPEKFTFPFYYQPHPLAIAVVQQLQQQLEVQASVIENADNTGKMFGVLVVKNSQQQLGYLAAYSGQLEVNITNISFVPFVSDMQLQDAAFLAENRIINNINAEIKQLENSDLLSAINHKFNQASETYQQKLLTQQRLMVASRKDRKQQRSAAIEQLSDRDFEQLKYQFLNANGETKDLNAIFADLPEHTPPAGAGDCAAPKLLQYAYQHDFVPIAMAEFWWGAAPKSAIRQHKNYYPSCYSKCQPILGHMLKGLDVDDNPLLINPALGKDLVIVYQDADLLVVNKPAEFLSVPGKNIEDSVYLRIKTQFPHASGPLLVHRLDMSTSGLLLIALNKRAHKALQKQFIERTIEKRYVALVAGDVTDDSGVIDLPLRLDFDDKPRQMVCYQHGKQALTTWQVLERKNNTTRLHLFPKTGRTHQLRVHCAHKLGLNMPIVGDDHYGLKADRLHLHAEYLSFNHPISHQIIEFEVPAPF